MSFGFADSWFFLKMSLNLSLCNLSLTLLSGLTQEYPNFHAKALQIPKRVVLPHRFSVDSSSPSQPPPHTACDPTFSPQAALCASVAPRTEPNTSGLGPHGLSSSESPVHLKNSRKEFFHTGRGSFLSFLSFLVNNLNTGLNQLCIKSAVL